ncbi:MAG: hypothetical protein KJO69_02870 [Gammaproteobacteria bacterium]|nr:hypothetical protein [Gammaproteobacteria bacterium]
MSGIIAGAAVLGGGLSYLGTKKAGEAAATGQRDAAAITSQASEQARADLAPFRAAGYDALGQYQGDIQNRPSSVPIFDPYQQTAAPTGFNEMGNRFTGTRFEGTSPEGRFTGDRFGYDPNQAMQSPDIQFLQQQGEQALMRNLAGNRNLGSGSRMMDIMKFNQGLASQGLNDYYNRQFQMNQENYLRDRGEEQSAYGRDVSDYDRARAAEQESYRRSLGEEESAYQRGLQERQVGLDDWQREQQRQLSNTGATQKAVLDRYNLGLQAYNDRMSRLADLINVGSGAGQASASNAISSGNQLANISQNLGATQGAADIGRFNALSGTLGQLGTLYGLQQGGYFTNPYTTNQQTLQGLPTAGSGFY